MRKPMIDPKVFAERRARLAQQVSDAAVILTSHPEYIRNNDVSHAYRQDSNFYYLTGYEEPESILVFRPGKTPETVMFVRDKDLERETWDGFRYGPEGAKAEFGFDAVYSMSEFSEVVPKLLAEVSKLYYRFFYFEQYDKLIEQAMLDTKSLIRRSGKGNLPVEDAYQLIGEMRIVKSTFELEQMKRSGVISCEAHRKVMSATRPGMNERALHAVFLKSMMEQGCAREAYHGIFASGNSATTLHYVFNDQDCQQGDLLLVDAGGELNFYAADITRTYPVSGKFGDAQKRIYQKLLNLQKRLITRVKPGESLYNLQREAVKSLTEIMIEERLLKGNVEANIKEQNFMRYYPHGVGHWLGMDVHDAGLSLLGGEPRQFVPGMVFTVEPGIYIPASDKSAPAALRGIGIRIEDNVIVTETGGEVISANAPKDIEELEELIGKDY